MMIVFQFLKLSVLKKLPYEFANNNQVPKFDKRNQEVSKMIEVWEKEKYNSE